MRRRCALLPGSRRIACWSSRPPAIPRPRSHSPRAQIAAGDPDAVLVVLSADHRIPDAAAFAASVRRAAPAAAAGALVTLGVEPTRAETGYGYIRLGRPAGRDFPGLHRVARFVEKPDRARARALSGPWRIPLERGHLRLYGALDPGRDRALCPGSGGGARPAAARRRKRAGRVSARSRAAGRRSLPSRSTPPCWNAAGASGVYPSHGAGATWAAGAPWPRSSV